MYVWSASLLGIKTNMLLTQIDVIIACKFTVDALFYSRYVVFES